MVNTLTPFLAVVDHYSIALVEFLLLSHSGRDPHQMSDQMFVFYCHLLNHTDALLRNYENVSRCLWLNVSKGK